MTHVCWINRILIEVCTRYLLIQLPHTVLALGVIPLAQLCLHLAYNVETLQIQYSISPLVG